jgi:hypothetical protein
MRNDLITDEHLEQLGFEKIVVTNENRESALKEYLEITDKQINIIGNNLVNAGIRFNNSTYHENATWFKLAYNRFLEKVDDGYLFMIFDRISNFINIDPQRPTVIEEHVSINGPFWVTVIFTLNDLYNLLDILHIEYNEL